MNRTFSQSELEAIAAALADTSEGLTGAEIGRILAALQMVDPTPTMTKWKRLYNAFLKSEIHAGNHLAIMAFIRQAVKPEKDIIQPKRCELIRTNLCLALAFSGRTVSVAGEVHKLI